MVTSRFLRRRSYRCSNTRYSAGKRNAASAPAPPFTECPAIGAAPSCDILLVVNPDQTITVTGDSSVGPYDGSDDTLVGVVNNSSSAISAITVSGPGSGLAGFDGDDICTYAAGGGQSAGAAPDSPATATATRSSSRTLTPRITRARTTRSRSTRARKTMLRSIRGKGTRRWRAILLLP